MKPGCFISVISTSSVSYGFASIDDLVFGTKCSGYDNDRFDISPMGRTVLCSTGYTSRVVRGSGIYPLC